MNRQGLVTSRVWEHQQSKWAEVVVRSKADVLYRATIRRNAFDEQCRLIVEMWGLGQGWKPVLTRVVDEYPDVKAVSYVHREGTWESTLIVGCYRLLNEADALFSGLDFAFLQPGKEASHV